VGAGIGLAFALKSGEEFRNELGERMKKKADELGGVTNDYAHRSQMPVT
jgi:gas vesicle protein